MKLSKIRRFDSDCHVLEFDPKVYRFDVTIGKHMVLERLSAMNGEPEPDEYTIAKINGGFFSMNGSTEFIGSYVDHGLFYQGSDPIYPTAYFDKDYRLKVDFNPSLERHAWYQANVFWAIGCPWTIVVNGKKDFTYSEKELTQWYMHPKARHPRTMMGQRKDGTIVLVVVDGRSRWDLGINMHHQAAIMLELGCDIAFNLDGGGSSEIIYKDDIINTPSDRGRERRIGTAFMVYAKKQPTTPQGGKVQTPTPQGTVERTGIVTAKALNVRNKPLNGRVITCVYRNDKVKIVDVDKDTGWYRLDIPAKNSTGPLYASNNYINLI